MPMAVLVDLIGVSVDRLTKLKFKGPVAPGQETFICVPHIRFRFFDDAFQGLKDFSLRAEGRHHRWFPR